MDPELTDPLPGQCRTNEHVLHRRLFLKGPSRVAQAMGQLDSPIPNFILLDPIPGGNEFESFKAGNWAGWLGAEHSPVRLGGEYTQLLNAAAETIPQQDRESRETLRKFLTAK